MPWLDFKEYKDQKETALWWKYAYIFVQMNHKVDNPLSIMNFVSFQTESICSRYYYGYFVQLLII